MARLTPAQQRAIARRVAGRAPAKITAALDMQSPAGKRSYSTANRPRTSSKASGHRGLYDSPEWRSRRKAQLVAHPACRACGKLATVADHVERVTDPNDRRQVLEGALQSLCWPCHQQKSADDRAKAVGRKPRPIRKRIEIDAATGLPLPGQDHWWSDQ